MASLIRSVDSEATLDAPLPYYSSEIVESTAEMTTRASSSRPAPVIADIDVDELRGDFPAEEVVEHHHFQQDKVESPRDDDYSRALIVYEPKKEPDLNSIEGLQVLLENAVFAAVREKADELYALVLYAEGEDNDKTQKQVEESDSNNTPEEAPSNYNNQRNPNTNDQWHQEGSSKDDAEKKNQTPQNAQANDNNQKSSEISYQRETPSAGSVTEEVRQAQPATRLVARIPNISFEIPAEVKVSNDIINKLVPSEESVRDIVGRNVKHYSFYDRLRGWNMECKKRLNGNHQYDKYYKHMQSNTVTRSVSEIARFILFETTPRQMRDANKKRKMETLPQFTNYQFGIENNEAKRRRRMETPTPEVVRSENDDDMEEDDADEDLPSAAIYAQVQQDNLDESHTDMWFRVSCDNFMNYPHTYAQPSEEQWERMKAVAKRKANRKANPRDESESTAKSDIEAANVLIGMAEKENYADKGKQKMYE